MTMIEKAEPGSGEPEIGRLGYRAMLLDGFHGAGRKRSTEGGSCSR